MINFEYTLISKPDLNSKKWPSNSFKWSVKINNIQFDYYTGCGLVKANGKPKPPKLDDVLYCLLSDSEATFESFDSWCDNLGYDTDSRKALDIYLQCQEIYNKLLKTGINIENERKRLEDY